MRISDLMQGGSVLAIVLAGTLVAQPAFAQTATGSAVSDKDDTAAKADDDDDATAIIVTARRKALQTAIELKKNSDTIIDSVVADEAGRLPDNSITEVLARVPGVTMSRFSAYGDSFQVEGTGIQVRGLSQATSLLNGREIFSANGGSGLSWGEVTPELMAAVDVYKATRVDMIEGGTGGAIDLRTKMPFDYKKGSIEGSIGGSWGDIVKKVSPSLSILGTKRWNTPVGEVGLLVDVAYSKLNSQASYLSVEPFIKRQYQGQDRYIPQGFGWGDSHFGRERKGFYEAFQWKPADNFTFFQTFFRSRYTSHNDGTGVWVASDHAIPTSGEATFDSNGVLVTAEHMGYASFGQGDAGSTIGQGWIPANQQVDCNTPYGTQAQSLNWGASPPNCVPVNFTAGSSRNFSTTDNLTTDISEGFTWDIGRLRVKAAAQYVKSTARSTGMSVGLNVPVTGFSVDLSGKTPDVSIDNSDALNDPASYQWGQMSWRPSHNRGTMFAANTDLSYALSEDGFFRAVDAGFRIARRDESDRYDGTYWSALGQGWNGSPVTHLDDGPPEDSEFYEFDGFFHGGINVPGNFYVPSQALISSRDYNYVMNTYGYTQQDEDGDGVPDSPLQVLDDDIGRSRTSLDTDSVYLQTKFGSTIAGVPFTGNIGVRAVRTRTKSSGNFVFGQRTFYLTQADANADFQADPTGVNTPNAITLLPVVTPRSAKSKDTQYLPAFNINFKPSDKFFIRLAANKTVSRPSFGDITVDGSGSVMTVDNTNNYTEQGPNGQIQHVFPGILNGMSAQVGNTFMKPAISRNLDLSLEWYKSWSTTAHVAFFHKKLKDLAVFGDDTVAFPYTFTKENGEVVSGVTNFTTTQVINAKEDATIKGFEFGGQTFFDKLPGLLSGFGVNANFTFIDSKNQAPKARDVNGDVFKSLTVTGLSKYSYNVQLMYSKNKFYAGLAYNWRSRFLMGTSVNGTGMANNTNYRYCNAGVCQQIYYNLPLYGHAYGQLDFGANYQVNDHLRVSLQANNLTNVTARSDMQITPGKYYPRNFYEADRRVDFGINFKL